MSEARKTSPDDLYFVTLTVVGWINLFDREIYKEILVENLNLCQLKEGLEIFAYVIMSNHLHLICRRNEKDLTELLGRFKSYTSKQFLKEIQNNPEESRKEWLLFLFKKYANMNKQYKGFHIWQYTNHPVLLYTNCVIDQKIDYIHVKFHNVVDGIILNLLAKWRRSRNEAKRFNRKKVAYIYLPQKYKYAPNLPC